MKAHDDALPAIVAEVARLTRKLADRRFEPIGLTRAQWLALVYLDRRGPMTQSALADLIEIETATVARLIDRLEASGWVERRPGPDDRRVKLVSMTDKAQCIMEEVGTIGQRLREDMLTDLPPDERDHLVSALSTVKSRLLRLLETQ
jgi:MarR family transcriptional regulator for hemolysin